MNKTLAVLALVAIASLPSTASAQTIQACYVAKTGTVYRINVSDTPPNCGKNTAFHWNVTGPAGQTGPQGPAGSGSTFYVLSTAPTDHTSPSLGASAECYEGDLAIGGGYRMAATDPTVMVHDDSPWINPISLLPTRWHVGIKNPNSSTFTLSVWVVCAKTTS